MPFRIERVRNGEITTLLLIGRLEPGSVEELKKQIERGQRRIVLDLAEVELVAVEVVRFLNASQDAGIMIANASPYIREWMLRERKDHKIQNNQRESKR